MFPTILQTTPEVENISTDSLLVKGTQIVEAIKETPPNELLGADIDKVRKVLLDLASQQELILSSKTPGAGDPYVVVGSLNDSDVEVLLRVWSTGADFMTVLFWLNEHIYSELPKHGINFPFPQMNIHVKNN